MLMRSYFHRYQASLRISSYFCEPNNRHFTMNWHDIDDCIERSPSIEVTFGIKFSKSYPRAKSVKVPDDTGRNFTFFPTWHKDDKITTRATTKSMILLLMVDRRMLCLLVSSPGFIVWIILSFGIRTLTTISDFLLDSSSIQEVKSMHGVDKHVILLCSYTF